MINQNKYFIFNNFIPFFHDILIVDHHELLGLLSRPPELTIHCDIIVGSFVERLLGR